MLADYKCFSQIANSSANHFSFQNANDNWIFIFLNSLCNEITFLEDGLLFRKNVRRAWDPGLVDTTLSSLSLLLLNFSKLSSTSWSWVLSKLSGGQFWFFKLGYFFHKLNKNKFIRALRLPGSNYNFLVIEEWRQGSKLHHSDILGSFFAQVFLPTLSQRHFWQIKLNYCISNFQAIAAHFLNCSIFLRKGKVC